MITVVCGYIGAGKSTFCNKKEGVVILDFDYLSGGKMEQLSQLLGYLTKNIHYITCYPTPRELEIFDSDEVIRAGIEYVWINTSIDQASKNILKRGDPDDLKFYQEKVSRNLELQNKYFNSDIEFKIVDVFSSNERW